MAFVIHRFVRELPPRPASVAADKQATKVPIRRVLSIRNVVICVLIAPCYLTWFVTMITFAPRYLTEVKGWAPSTMSAVMTCLGVAWVLWGFATPGISDRVGRKPALTGFTLLAVCCPLAVVFVDSPWALGALMILTHTGLGCFTLFMATIPAETVPPAALATALGVIMGVGELAGGFLGPLVSGWVSDQWGPQAAMYIAAAGAVVVVLLTFGLRETAPRVLHRRAGNDARASAPTVTVELVLALRTLMTTPPPAGSNGPTRPSSPSCGPSPRSASVTHRHRAPTPLN